MPFGVDDVSALVGLIGFSASFLEACIKGLLMLSKARSYGRDVSGISLMFELELHKLYRWAEEAGLSQQPPVLTVDSQYASVVPRVLEHLQELLSDLDKLKRVYGLQLQETADELMRLDDGETAFERLRIDQEPDRDHVLARIFKQRRQPWKVLKWITFDDQRVRKLLDQVRLFIHELQQVLDWTRQARLAKAVDIVLRSAVLNTASEQDLDMLGSNGGAASPGHDVAAAARFKKQGLLLGIMDIEQTPSKPGSSSQTDALRLPLRKRSYPPLSPRYSNSDLAEMRLAASRLSIASYSPHDSRTLASYGGRSVLLEFRGFARLDHDSEKDRVCKVSAFLHDLDPSFHGLSCLGYVKVHDRYAYVFDLGEVSTADATPRLPSLRTLRDLLDGASCPSLNMRVSFAITILETLLQLHTSGWLHKEFRSDNALFILPSSDHIDSFLGAQLRIAGYTYAHADQLHEPTEPLQSELEADLYRHPACLQQPPERFCRAFDMFSVGCMLLEVGLWCTLSTLFRRAAGRPQETESQTLDLMRQRHDLFFSPTSNGTTQPRVVVKSDWLHQLEASTGKAYASIVKKLLYGLEPGDTPPTHQSNLLHLEIDCLEGLRTIAQVL